MFKSCAPCGAVCTQQIGSPCIVTFVAIMLLAVTTNARASAVKLKPNYAAKRTLTPSIRSIFKLTPNTVAWKIVITPLTIFFVPFAAAIYCPLFINGKLTILILAAPIIGCSPQNRWLRIWNVFNQSATRAGVH
jgi:hypothetical protein